MFKLSRYIFRRLAVTTLFITVVTTVALWFTQSKLFIELIVNNGLSLAVFFNLAVFLLPEIISLVLPAALLAAVIHKYNRLVADNELNVMRSAGMSNWQLAKPALFLAIITMCLLYFIGLYVLPNSLRNLKDMQHSIKHTITGSMFRAGEFTTFKGNTVYIRERRGETELLGLVIHHKPKDREASTIVAQKGSVVETRDGTKMVLFDGIRQEYNPDSKQPSLVNFAQYTVNLDFGAEQTDARQKKPYEYYITDLLFPDESITRATQFGKFKARGHQKIITPLYALVFALLGSITFLYGDYNRRGRANRIILTTSGCIILYSLTISLINFSEKSFGALILAYLVVIAPLVLSIGYLREWRFLRQWRRFK